MPSTTAGTSSRGYTRLVLASCFGTAIEWYDFFIYAFLAPLIASALLLQFDNSFVPVVIYFLALATIALVATIAATETLHKTI